MNLKGFLALAVCLAVAGVALADDGMGYSDPKSVTAVCGVSSAQVSWDAIENGSLSGYNVYKKAAGESTYVKTNTALILETQFTVPNLSSAVTYDFKVTAVYNTQGESAGSSPATCTTG